MNGYTYFKAAKIAAYSCVYASGYNSTSTNFFIVNSQNLVQVQVQFSKQFFPVF